MIPADILRLAQEAGLIAKGVAHDYQLPVQIGRFAELVWQQAMREKLAYVREKDKAPAHEWPQKGVETLADGIAKSLKGLNGGQA